MDWTQTLTIIGVFAAFFIYLMNRMDVLKTELKSEMKELRNDLKGEMNQRFGDVTQRLSAIETENRDIGKRLSTIEGALIPRNILPFEQPQKHEEESKEN